MSSMILQKVFKKNILNNYINLPENITIFFNDKNFFKHYKKHTNQFENIIILKKLNINNIFELGINNFLFKQKNINEINQDKYTNKINLIIHKKDLSKIRVDFLKELNSIYIINFNNIFFKKEKFLNHVNSKITTLVLNKFNNNLFIKFIE